jgi:hypothetical protein
MSTNIGAEIVAALQQTDVWQYMKWLMSQPPAKFGVQPGADGNPMNAKVQVGAVSPEQASGTLTALRQGLPVPTPPAPQAQPQPGQVSPQMAATAVAALRGQRSQRPTAYEASGDDPQDVRLMAMGYRPRVGGLK